MIPGYDDHGRLPQGVHNGSWEDVERRFGFNDHRRRLLCGLKDAAMSLRSAGCRVLYLDGSFVTNKELPGDFDGCWDVTGVDPARLDPALLNFEPGRLTQNAKFGGELFPTHIAANPGGDTFLEFFQTAKEDGQLKGIVALDLGSLP